MTYQATQMPEESELVVEALWIPQGIFPLIST